MLELSVFILFMIGFALAIFLSMLSIWRRNPLWSLGTIIYGVLAEGLLDLVQHRPFDYFGMALWSALLFALGWLTAWNEVRKNRKPREASEQDSQ